MSPLPFLFNTVLEILTIEIRLENEIIDINIGKEEVEVKNPREPVTKKGRFTKKKKKPRSYPGSKPKNRYERNYSIHDRNN